MAYSYPVVITGASRAEKAVRDFIWKDGDWKEIGSDVHQRLLDWQKKVFETSGKAAGQRWPGVTILERQYYRWKETKLEGAITDPSPELRWTATNERLYPSLTDKGHKDHKWKVLKDGYVFGTTVPYAWKHQEGSGKASFTSDWNWSITQRSFITADPSVGAFRSVLSEITRLMRKSMGL